MILHMVTTTGSETCSTMNPIRYWSSWYHKCSNNRISQIDQTNKTANDAKVFADGRPCWATRFGLPLQNLVGKDRMPGRKTKGTKQDGGRCCRPCRQGRGCPGATPGSSWHRTSNSPREARENVRKQGWPSSSSPRIPTPPPSPSGIPNLSWRLMSWWTSGNNNATMVSCPIPRQVERFSPGLPA